MKTKSTDEITETVEITEDVDPDQEIEEEVHYSHNLFTWATR